eukprot:gene11884-13117_t
MDSYKIQKQAKKVVEPKEPWDVYVSQGCKPCNVIPHCMKMLKTNSKIVLTGVGPQIKKAISMAEILKKNSKGLEQITDIYYTKVEDIWQPVGEESEGFDLDTLKVTKNIPSIKISLYLSHKLPTEHEKGEVNGASDVKES